MIQALQPETCSETRKKTLVPSVRERVDAPVRGHRHITPIRMQLNRRDVVTGTWDDLHHIFFAEAYEGYMIYSLPGGWCCIHTKHGCLQLDGLFACFPTSHDAIRLIDWFIAHRWTVSDARNRTIPSQIYLSLSRRRKRGVGRP